MKEESGGPPGGFSGGRADKEQWAPWWRALEILTIHMRRGPGRTILWNPPSMKILHYI